jgi:hypothetical protein
MLLLLAPLGTASARPQETSLADAARNARQQKKAPPKAAKVWDNDTISQTTGRISVVGQTPPPGAATEAKPAEAKAPEMTAGAKAALEAELTAAKDKLATVKTDLDILQRKYVLDRQAFYGKVDYASDRAGAAALQGEQSQIDSQQQQVADAQKKIDELQEKLKAAGAEKSS